MKTSLHFSLALASLVFMACGSEIVNSTNTDALDGETSSQTGNKESCVPGVGGPGSVAISLDGELRTVESGEGMAMNTMEEDGAPWRFWYVSPIAASTCGDAGLVYTSGEFGHLYYVRLSPTAEEPVLVDDEWNLESRTVALVYDSNCEPMVVTVTPDDGLVYFIQVEDGPWQSVSTGAGAAQGGNVALSAVKNTPSGEITAFIERTNGEQKEVVALKYDPATAMSWTPRTVALPDVGMVFDYAMGSDGLVRMVHQAKLEFPCDPCDLDLLCSVEDGNGNWLSSVIQDSRWGDPDDRFSEPASLVLTPDNTPIVAACYQERVITGSLKKSELRVYSRDSDGDWCYETVVDQQDGFAGGDGSHFTGQEPMIRLGPAGEPVVLFHDLSEWHDSNGANGIVGQPRLAVRSQDRWSMLTLHAQPGQQDSPNPLHGFRNGRFAVTPTGLVFGGVEFIWETDSIYNNTEVPIHFKLFSGSATVAWP